MSAKNQETGKLGEKIAQDHIKARGYTVLALNWYCRYGEIDIVAQHGETVVFIEVRARRAATTEFAFASIQEAKREKMTRAVQLYLNEHQLEESVWRIDVIAIALNGKQAPIIDHVEDAFDW